MLRNTKNKSKFVVEGNPEPHGEKNFMTWWALAFFKTE